MAVVTELNGTRGGAFDSEGQGERRRLWVVHGVHPNGIDRNTVHTLYPPIPAVGTPYEVGSNLVLDRYDFDLFEDGVSALLIGIYTSTRLGRLPTNPMLVTSGQGSWAHRTQDVVIDIPYGRFDEFADRANPSATYSAWARHTWKSQEVHVLWTLRVTGKFNSQDDMADGLAEIGKQANRIHLIHGKLMRYVGGNSQQIGSDFEWTITHEWEQDDGTPVVPPPGTPSRFFMPPGIPEYGDVCRPPFWRLDMYDAANPLTTPPFLAYFNPRLLDEDGWQGLPGVPGSL